MIRVEECPNCGAPASVASRTCTHCKAEFLVTSLACAGGFNNSTIQKYITLYKRELSKDVDNAEASLALGVCYIQLGLYPLALRHLEKAIELAPEVGDGYYYYAFALIGGRPLRTLRGPEIDRILQYLNTSTQLDDTDSKHRFLGAAVRADYHEANCLRVPAPSVRDLLTGAYVARHSRGELERIKDAIPIRNALVRELIEKSISLA